MYWLAFTLLISSLHRPWVHEDKRSNVLQTKHRNRKFTFCNKTKGNGKFTFIQRDFKMKKYTEKEWIQFALLHDLPFFCMLRYFCICLTSRSKIKLQNKCYLSSQSYLISYSSQYFIKGLYILQVSHTAYSLLDHTFIPWLPWRVSVT